VVHVDHARSKVGVFRIELKSLELAFLRKYVSMNLVAELLNISVVILLSIYFAMLSTIQAGNG